MAKGPNDIAARRAEVISRAERVIDQAIEGLSHAYVTIAIKLLNISSSEWEMVLKPKYIAAGWHKAEWVSDQREGDYIRLEA